MTVEKLLQAQQMKRYLEALGVSTEVDFAQERLYVVMVQVKYPEFLNCALKETNAHLPQQS